MPELKSNNAQPMTAAAGDPLRPQRTMRLAATMKSPITAAIAAVRARNEMRRSISRFVL